MAHNIHIEIEILLPIIKYISAVEYSECDCCDSRDKHEYEYDCRDHNIPYQFDSSDKHFENNPYGSGCKDNT